MTAEELLIAILGPKYREAYVELLGRHQGFREIGAAHPLDWRDAGLSGPAVEKLRAVFEVAPRYGETEWRVGEAFTNSSDVYAHYRQRLAAETVEFFIAVLLDTKNRKLQDVVLSQGSLTASIVHPRLCAATHKRGYVAAAIMWPSG